MNIKVDVKFDIKFNVELRDTTLDELMKMAPSIGYNDSDVARKTYYAYTEYTETFEFDSIAEMMVKLDGEIETHIETFLYRKFDSDVVYKNWFLTPSTKFEIIKIYGDYNAW